MDVIEKIDKYLNEETKDLTKEKPKKVSGIGVGTIRDFFAIKFKNKVYFYDDLFGFCEVTQNEDEFKSYSIK